MRQRYPNAKELKGFRPYDIYAVGKFVFQMGYTPEETKKLSGMSLPKIRDIKEAILAAVRSDKTEGLSKAIVKAVKKMLAKE
jgi:hypothetical protein